MTPTTTPTTLTPTMTPTTDAPAVEGARTINTSPEAGAAAPEAKAETPADTRSRLPAQIRSLVRGTRTRLLLTYVALLSLSLVASLLLIREVLISQVESRIDAELTQEAEELTRLVRGNDPRTGQPFGDDVEAIFRTFFARNVPNSDEGQYAFLNDEPFLVNAAPPAELTSDPVLVASLRGLDQPRRAWVDSTAGRAEYLALPLRVTDPATGLPTTRGVFVVAAFPAEQLSRVDRTVTRIGIGLLMVLAFASAAAWAAAGRVLAPLRQAIDTARSIQDTNLSSRIPVSGSDDIAELGRTFNAMLDRLERAAQSQRSFVSDAGHELRTPITIVRGHLELMTDDPDDRRETLALVTEELDRMSRLVDDLLLLAKSERSDFLQPQEVDIASLVPAVFAKVSALAPREWRLEGAAEARLEGDPQRLTQALTQLAQNATQHTADGDPITLGSSYGGGHVRLWVQDEGEGVEPSDQERIFERFARAAAGRRRSDGSGLGLSIVQAIAEAHGGHVELASRPGHGSTFSLVLPASPAPAATRARG